MTGERLARVLSLIDEANASDPNVVAANGTQVPADLLYGQRMSACLATFKPDATEHLQIAVRAQHLERWKLPRNAYPMDRKGYHQWRNEQKRRHAERVSELMEEAGYAEADRARVAAIVRKEGLKRDPESQALEDVACLVFLQHYAVDFAAGRERDQLVDIVAKTWRKMSDDGHRAALDLSLDPGLKEIVAAALDRAKKT